MITSSTPPQGLARWRADHASQIEDFRRGVRRFTRNRLSVIGLLIVLLMLAVALGMLAFFYRRGWIGGTRATPWEPSPPAEPTPHVAGIQSPKH